MFAFAGPAYLVSVGYMDPGNWATDLEGGARFGFQLLWVLVMSNLMAILLQTLSARLGIVTGRDLAQACRETYPRAISAALWVLCEIAIAACDLAEVIGAAIGLNLLFGIPLLAGVLLTSLDTLLLLWLSHLGIRVMEGFVLALVIVIAVCFGIEIFLARPPFAEIATGLIPRLSGESLYVAIGILGATVMPHNLYLHSALVQTRQIGSSESDKRTACRFNLIDSVVALNGALFVNAAILIVSATVFFRRGILVNEIQQAHEMLSPLVGAAAASVLFAVALLCAGQSSTITGTMAGQIVMEGFLNFRVRAWLRRLITRALAIAPAALTIITVGDKGTWKLLILSQVILSMQLPFAVIPLIHFTSDKRKMGTFATRTSVAALAWVTAAVIVALNVSLVYSTVREWLAKAPPEWHTVLLWTVLPLLIGLFLLLLWVTVEPWLPSIVQRRGRRRSVVLPSDVGTDLTIAPYRHVLVPLDHTDRDRLALSHAAALARSNGARVTIMHVEEGVTSQLYGDQARTAEVEAGDKYIADICDRLRAGGIQVASVIAHSKSPAQAIISVAKQIHADLVIMGAHGHSGIMDLILGTTINSVRHALHVPVLIVRNGK